MKTPPKPGDWVSLVPKTSVGSIRIDLNGKLWSVREVTRDRMLLKSAERTFGPKNSKTYDGMCIWLEHDVNFEWN